jgi:septum formation inhibitor-activating ATPase MinD
MNNVTLITNDIELYNIFLNSKLFDEVNIASSLDLKQDYKYLIVSDRICNINELVGAAEKGLKAEKTAYLMSSGKSSQSSYTALAALLKSQGINVFPPRLTGSQILTKFCDLINLQQRKINNVTVFFGADSKVGTTTTALGVAENLAAQGEGSVAFLNLSGHISFSHIDSSENKGMDSIRSKVFNKILSELELQDAMIQDREIKDLYILPSCNSLIDFRYYQTDHIEYIVAMASRIFDAVIVDAGWYPSNAFLFGALNTTPNRYMVTTQQQSSLSTHLLIKHQALDEYGITSKSSKKDSPNSIMLVVNRCSDAFSSNIVNGYDMVFAISLPKLPESEKRTLRGISNKYDRQLDKLTSLVALQMEYKLTIKKKSRFF